MGRPKRHASVSRVVNTLGRKLQGKSLKLRIFPGQPLLVSEAKTSCEVTTVADRCPMGNGERTIGRSNGGGRESTGVLPVDAAVSAGAAGFAVSNVASTLIQQ
jgi:hypothetical protein